MNWADNIAKKWMSLKIAERADGLASVRQARRSTHRLVRKMQDGTLGESDQMPDEDDSINIGDPQYHYHGQQQRGQGNQLATLALAAVLGAVGANWLPLLIKPSTPAVDATDRVNEYELSIGTEE